MPKLPISATVICKNEEVCMPACLASLDSCAEIVVVDSGSTDSTLAIIRDFLARGWPIRLIERGWPGYAKQKQFALEQATQDWVLEHRRRRMARRRIARRPAAPVAGAGAYRRLAAATRPDPVRTHRAGAARDAARSGFCGSRGAKKSASTRICWFMKG